MRRSKNGPEPSARGNFTPPPRGAAPAQVPVPEPVPAPAPSGGRLSPRNWRVPTRLNAILLIPVVVGLVMGGFQVKSSINTWQQAQDAEKTARLVQAALAYGDKLFVERDVTAQPLLENKNGKGAADPTVVKAYKDTDQAAAAFDRAAQNMPRTPGLERRLRHLPQGGARSRQPAQGRLQDQERGHRRGLPPDPAPADGVRQRARPGHRKHHQLRPYGLRDLALQGRAVPRAVHRHAPPGQAGPGPERSHHPAHRPLLVRLPGAHRRRGVPRRWHPVRRRQARRDHEADHGRAQEPGHTGRDGRCGPGREVRPPACSTWSRRSSA